MFKMRGNKISVNIGLLDIDGHNYPNLALMKISAYHKSIGDTVDWVNHFNHYDKVYKSKVFTFSPDNIFYIDAKEILVGGTGYDATIKLLSHIDSIYPDYSLYPKFDSAYGFLTRGCPNKCSWCIVPKKEGNIHANADIEDILGNRKSAVLMDNNVLASDWGIGQIEKIAKLNIKVDFNQGLDARLIDKPMARLLSSVSWLKPLRMACDSSSMKEPIRKAVMLLREHGCKPQRYFIYVLLQNLNDSYERVNFCKSLELDVHSQPFRDFTPNQIIPQWQNDMARYTNHHAIYKTIDFKDYIPRKGFKCSSYFN